MMSLIVALQKRYLNREFIAFFMASGIGLSVDLATFYILQQIGIYVFFCNVISSFLAISIVYLSSIKFVFNNSKHSAQKFIIFVAYYTFSVIVFSGIIAFISGNFNVVPIVAKITIVPFSFLFNYVCSAKIVR